MHGALRLTLSMPVILAAHVRDFTTNVPHGRFDRILDAGITRHVSEDIDRHFLRPSAHVFEEQGERYRAEIAHDEFEKDLAQDRPGCRFLPGQVQRRAAEDHPEVHEDGASDESVDDVVVEAVVTQVVAEDVEADKSHAAGSSIVVIECDHATGVQPLKVELEVGHCCLLQLDAPLASFLPVTTESRAEELGGPGCERRVDGEVILSVTVTAYADCKRVKEVVAAMLLGTKHLRSSPRREITCHTRLLPWP